MYHPPGSIPPPRRWWSSLTDPPQRRSADWWRLAASLLMVAMLGIVGPPLDFSRIVPRAGALIILGALSGAVAEVLPLRWRRLSVGLRAVQLVAPLIATGVFIGLIMLG